MLASIPLRSFAEIQAEWERLLSVSPVNNLFITPQWQEVWWETLSDGRDMAGFYIPSPEGVMAIASLARQGDTVSLLGSQDTFDYNDFLIRPGYEPIFFPTLLQWMESQGCHTLELTSLMGVSPTLAYLPELARQRGYSAEVREEDVVPGVILPSTWEEYLSSLPGKERHELRRKFRRLESVPSWRWYCLTGAEEVGTRFGDFVTLMRQSGEAKATYMTPERETFFHRIAQRTAQLGILRLFFLELDGSPVAASLCFDYGTSRLLYSSGFSPQHGYYSVGLLLNALCLRNAIETGQGYFDFLRGGEPYKYHLGGKNRNLYQLVVKRS